MRGPALCLLVVASLSLACRAQVQYVEPQIDWPVKTFLNRDKKGCDGRLGNKMFKFASALGIARTLNASLCSNVCSYELSPTFANLKQYTSTCPEELVNAGRFRVNAGRPTGYVDPVALQGHQHTEMRGYLQSWKYFTDISTEIKHAFEWPVHLKQRVADYMATFQADEFVGIHIRRTDMVDSDQYIFPSDSYFQQAMDLFRSMHARTVPPTRLKFLVLSDDPEWCLTREIFQMSDVAVIPRKKTLPPPTLDTAFVRAADPVSTIGDKDSPAPSRHLLARRSSAFWKKNKPSKNARSKKQAKKSSSKKSTKTPKKTPTVDFANTPEFDLCVLASCTGGVIRTVGSYGWWGAYLSGGTVVYYAGEFNRTNPKMLSNFITKDYHMPSWVGIES